MYTSPYNVVTRVDDPLPVDDGDFEVTAEMLIHDTMDDETTLAEEEAMRTQEEEEAEINDLQEVCKLVKLKGVGLQSK